MKPTILLSEKSFHLACRIYNETGKYSEAFRILKETDISERAKSSESNVLYYNGGSLYQAKEIFEAIEPLKTSLDSFQANDQNTD